MDGVIPARVGAPSIPTGLWVSNSLGNASTRLSSIPSTSGTSFSSVGSNANRGDNLVPGSAKKRGTKLKSAGTGSTVKVRASAKVSPLELIASIFGGKKNNVDANNVVYQGIATISKKRAELTNLVQLDLIDVVAALEDRAVELLGKRIQIQLVSEDLDPKTNAPKSSAFSSVNNWDLTADDIDLVADEDIYPITFTVPKDFGQPGAFVIKSDHPNEFYIKSLVLQAPDGTAIEFATNAWIYNHSKYPKDRVFFRNKVYLPSATPAGLKALREQELEQIRGNGTGERKAWDRIYDYDVYDDLGDPDQSASLARPVLGGSKEFPYPRRIRSGRPMSKKDPKTETRLSNDLDLPYIPSDEFFLRTKDSTFIAGFIKGTVHSVVPAIENFFEGTAGSFASYQEVKDLYKNGLPVKIPPTVDSSTLTPEDDAKRGDLVYLTTIFTEKGEDKSVLNYALPQLIATSDTAWETDEEFGREALAGLHPFVIELMKAYPPTSSLDPVEYGEGTALTDQHILPYLEGLTVSQAIQAKKLFIIDYHDAFLPFISEVNADTSYGFQAYAPRSIFFHTSAGQFKVIAIELSLPPAQTGGAALNRVFTPADDADHLWSLAKAHASAIDSNYHQVLSHFTFSHACMEPFIISTNRQLSELHPIKTLLKPYFKDTLSINAAARAVLVNAGGIVEKNWSMGERTFQVGSKGYGAFWRFDTQALPQSLVARGMAEPADASFPGSVKLLVEDYPFAKDGLEVWDAINKWVAKYVEITYKGSDEAIKADTELQAWWDEIVNVGHADLKDAAWWPKLDSSQNLVQIITTIAWIAGPSHAALNFLQYAYSGFPPNKPSATRRLIPEKGSAEYKELQENPEKFLLSTITTTYEATQVMTIMELLSTHSVDEEYIGKRNSDNWTTDQEVLAAFAEFNGRVTALEDTITKRNADPTLINRRGPVQMPYNVLFPYSTTGLTGQGVPNSVSI